MNNVTSKRVYEKAWRSHLQTGQMLKAEEKLHWRRKTPQIHFEENCTFYRYIPKQLYAASLICYGYSIKCSAFYNLGLCWSLSERAFGGGCTTGTELYGQYCMKSHATLGKCDPSHRRTGVRDDPVSAICCVMETDVDLDTNHHLMNAVYGLLTARSLWLTCPQTQHRLWMWAGNLAPHTGLWFWRPYKCWKFKIWGWSEVVWSCPNPPEVKSKLSALFILLICLTFISLLFWSRQKPLTKKS